MKNPFLIFWTVMIFASIGWYFLLLFSVGGRGASEIKRMTRALSERPSPPAENGPPPERRA
jgi:hypothetical protein